LLITLAGSGDQLSRVASTRGQGALGFLEGITYVCDLAGMENRGPEAYKLNPRCEQSARLTAAATSEAATEGSS